MSISWILLLSFLFLGVCIYLILFWRHKRSAGSVLRSQLKGEPGAWGSLAGVWPGNLLLDPSLCYYTRLFPRMNGVVFGKHRAQVLVQSKMLHGVLIITLAKGKSNQITSPFYLKCFMDPLPNVIPRPSPPSMIWTLLTSPEPSLGSSLKPHWTSFRF